MPVSGWVTCGQGAQKASSSMRDPGLTLSPTAALYDERTSQSTQCMGDPGYTVSHMQVLMTSSESTQFMRSSQLPAHADPYGHGHRKASTVHGRSSAPIRTRSPSITSARSRAPMSSAAGPYDLRSGHSQSIQFPGQSMYPNVAQPATRAPESLQALAGRSRLSVTKPLQTHAYPPACGTPSTSLGLRAFR